MLFAEYSLVFAIRCVDLQTTVPPTKYKYFIPCRSQHSLPHLHAVFGQQTVEYNKLRSWERVVHVAFSLPTVHTLHLVRSRERQQRSIRTQLQAARQSVSVVVKRFWAWYVLDYLIVQRIVDKEARLAVRVN